MTRTRPTLTVDQYRYAARLLQVEVAGAAWGLVITPVPAGEPRRWRALTAEESEALFDRLLAACGRFSVSDKATVER